MIATGPYAALPSIQLPGLLYNDVDNIYGYDIDISIFLKYRFILIRQNKISIFSIFFESFSVAVFTV